jgi:hypothetical protein
VAGAGARKARLSKELEEIKRMRELGQILKVGDVENALLSNAAKDSETVNENVLDTLLSNANASQPSANALEVIERLTTTNNLGETIVKSKRIRVQKTKRGKLKVKRMFHFIKKRSPGAKATGKRRR